MQRTHIVAVVPRHPVVVRLFRAKIACENAVESVFGSISVLERVSATRSPQLSTGRTRVAQKPSIDWKVVRRLVTEVSLEPCSVERVKTISLHHSAPRKHTPQSVA